MPDHGLEAVFFDIDDTLYSSTDFAEHARTQSIEAMLGAGLRASQEQVRTLLREVIDEHDSNFQFQFDEVLRRLPEDSYRPVNPAIIVSSAVTAYHDLKFRELKPFDDVVPVLTDLRKRGARLGVVTQGRPTKQAEKLVRMGLVRFFEPELIFITEQMAAGRKEDPQLWVEVARKACVNPARCMFVGDHPVRDVEVPAKVGFVTVLVKRGGKYSSLPRGVTPTHEVNNLIELDHVLRHIYGV
jgi:putative hydrolase of the HAD superfamily